MQIKLHKNATTAIVVRQAIQKSHLSAYVIAKQYGISENTARRWKDLFNPEDASSCPHKINTALTPEEGIFNLF
jgi:transposase